MAVIPNLIHHEYNYSDATIDASLLGVATIHDGLIVLEGCKTILRRDYEQLHEKVKVICCGSAENELAHIGFVGPGMLTAMILGNNSIAPSLDAILRVIAEVSCNSSAGILLILQDYSEYRINFSLAISEAEAQGYIVKIITINNDINAKLCERTMEKKSSLAEFFIYKIGGAMSEEGRSLDEIYSVCNNIANREVVSLRINVGTVTSKASEESAYDFVESTSRSVSDILKMFNDLNKTRMSNTNHEAVIMINNIGCNQVQTNIFTLEILKQSRKFDLKVKRVYTTSLMTGLESSALHVCFLNLTSNPTLINYLDAPTSAPAWPRILSSEVIGIKKDGDVTPITLGRYWKIFEHKNIPDIEPQGLLMDCQSASIFLTIISVACEALVACTKQLNIIGEESRDENYGTNLARGANTINTAIKGKKLIGKSPFAVFTQISYIFGRVVGGFQGGLYSLFFGAAAKEFTKYQSNEEITIETWLNVLTTANKAIADLGRLSVGDRTMLDSLIPAQIKLADALCKKLDPIDAFGAAVKAAEDSAIETVHMQPLYRRPAKYKKFKYPDPGAHAVGIWMRGAYEATKLKLISHNKIK